MRKNAYWMALCALLLSACLLLSPSPAYARQRTVVRTENVLPAQEPESAYTSDWLSEELESDLLRLEDWVLPEAPQYSEEEIPAEDSTVDPGDDISELYAGDDNSEGLQDNSRIRNTREAFPLAKESNFVYNNILNDAENRDILTFRASEKTGEPLREEDFSVRFYSSPPDETRISFSDDYLIPTVSVKDDEVSIRLSLDESAFTIEQPTDVYIEVVWKTMAAQAVIRLIPYGMEPAPLISDFEEADDVLYISARDLSDLLALRAEALPDEQLGDWRLRVSFTDADLADLPDETAVFQSVTHLGYRNVCENGMIYLQGDALFMVPEGAEGRLLLNLARTNLIGNTEGTLRLESFGAALPDRLSPMPDAALRGGFILSPDADEATLSVDDDWLGCTLSYQLWELEPTGQFVERQFDGPQTEGESLTLRIDPTAEDKLPAGSYRLTLIWSIPGGTILYEKTISFFIGY